MTLEFERRPRTAYWVIDAGPAGADGSYRFRVWRRTGPSPEAELVGEFGSADQARAAVDVPWREAGSQRLVAWAWGPANVAGGASATGRGPR